MAFTKKYQVGEVRPTQLLLNYGVGAIMDLPHISALVMGLEDWETANTREINEDRLLQAVQSTWYGSQVKRLLSPPSPPSATNKPFENTKVCRPVTAFPR